MAKKTILIVDDLPPTRRFLRSVLEREGYNVVEAEDEASAWDAVRHQATRIDLALIDINLPGIKGRDVANNLQAFAPLPVVFMTGDDVATLLSDGNLEEGAPLVQKPFTVTRILDAINRLLKEERQRAIDAELLR